MISITLGNGISFYIDKYDHIGFQIENPAWSESRGNKFSLRQKATKHNIDNLIANIERLRVHGTDS